MSKIVFFLNMFSDYQPPESLQGILSQVAVTAADIDPQNRSISVRVFSENYITMKTLQEIADDIAGIYDLRSFVIEPHYPPIQRFSMPPEDLMQLFV